VPPGLPPVNGDRTYLEQVVRSLVANAAKYGPPTAVVEVKAEVRPGEIAVLVLDEGPGFSADEAGNLFDLFYRSPATAKKASGAGIGLYVARALIEAMGGRIWARVRPEGGAEFGFTVPILETDDEPSAFESAGEAHPGIDPAALDRAAAREAGGVAIP
jgi:K+-sensing histidine kinase KdpD